jgi:hypothetical protein
MRGLEIPEDQRRLVMHAPEDDRSIRSFGKLVVDALDDHVKPLLERMIFRNRRPARRRQLHEDQAPAVLREALEQALDGEQPLLDALRVIEPVDADAEQRVGREAELGKDLSAALLDRRGRYRPAVRPVNRYRIGANQRAHATVDDRVELAIDPRFEEAIDRVEEVVAVELRVEAQDAAAQQAVQDLLGKRADTKPLEVRPWDVPEGDDRRARLALANQSRCEGEVIVLHQDDRIVGIHLLAHRIGEPLVDVAIGVPVGAAEDGPRVRDVTQRPEALVREPIVIALLFFGRQPDAPQYVVALARRHRDAILRIH